ncbi:MAG: hypothetical protein Q8N44_12905 [Rubrivivax sp.]|nr:hypothetical protein [Rubrivivax sp.]
MTLRHLGTHVMFDKPRAHPLSGQTLWGGRAGDGDAGLAWDWVQLSQGVLALADPLCIVTNLRLLDDGGEPLAPMPAARWLNQIVHTLPWQDAVVQAIRRPP